MADFRPIWQYYFLIVNSFYFEINILLTNQLTHSEKCTIHRSNQHPLDFSQSKWIISSFVIPNKNIKKLIFFCKFSSNWEILNTTWTGFNFYKHPLSYWYKTKNIFICLSIEVLLIAKSLSFCQKARGRCVQYFC